MLRARRLATLALLPGAAACAVAGPSLTAHAHAEVPLTARATGTFEVKLNPQPADDYTDAATLGRLTIDKRFHGDLEATSKGQMLTGGAVASGSAGYVAIERVTGTLGGRRGTFILQHSGTMTRGAPHLLVTVVPDSGTDGLTGLTGSMTIEATGGRHAYAFEYTLPSAP